MKKNNNLAKALEMIRNMSQEERDIIVSEIFKKMGSDIPEEFKHDAPAGCDSIIAEVRPQKPDCPRCGAKAELGFIVKDGKDKGKPRYHCKACNRNFSLTTNTVFANTRKSAETWRKYIEMTISGKSIAACAKECGLSIQASFEWRHKILNVFIVNQDGTKMTGNVEVDEMQIPLSYKGNHVQGGFGIRRKTADAVNDMPRKAYRRGSDNKSRHASDKACVFCMVQDGNKAFYAAVPGTGFMNEKMLNATIAKHVNKDMAVMLADDYNVTRRYFEKNGYEHVILKSNTSDNPKEHKVEVKNGLHIQHVNAMHRHIRKFLAPYCGVSSKYLESYTALYVWLSNIKATKQRNSIEKVSVARAAANDCYITRREVLNRPMVPTCA